MITSLGEKELVCVLLMHLFVCFVHINFCHFSLPLSVGGWLRFVTGTPYTFLFVVLGKLA